MKTLRARFWSYVLPSIVSMWVFSLYTMADGVFVARGVGETALAAVNLSAPLTSFIFAAGLLFATGTSVVVSNALGRGDAASANNRFRQNLAAMGILGLALTVAVSCNLDAIARFLGATESTLPYVREYAGTIALFAVFFIVSYNLEVLVKVDGAPQVSTVGVASCAVMNVALDALFVLKFHWGARGAALATGLAQVTSTMVFLLYFLRRGRRLKLGRFRPEPGVYRRIVPAGAGEAFAELSGGAVTFLFNRAALAYAGETGLVAYTVIGYVNMVTLMTMTGISQGMQPLVSYERGRENRAACRSLLRMGLTAACVAGVAAAAAAAAGAPAVTACFLSPEDSPEMRAYAVAAMRRFAPAFALMGVNVVSAGYFAAVERTRQAAALSAARGLACPAAMLALTGALWGSGGIWYSAAASEALCLVLTGLFFVSIRRARRAH